MNGFPEMRMVKDKMTGADLSVCAAHGLERCGKCCMDFTDINDMAREEARIQEVRPTSMIIFLKLAMHASRT